MSPRELVDLAFELLDDTNSVAIDEYFTDDPSGITYCKIALAEPQEKVVSMALQATWFNGSQRIDTAEGPREWQHAVALFLVSTPPGVP